MGIVMCNLLLNDTFILERVQEGFMQKSQFAL